jgi:hypothetical protein
MANEEHLAWLKQGVAAWNQWRLTNRNLKPDLAGADLTHLHGARLSEANLAETDLTDADLEADFAKANLTEANLTETNLASMCLTSADLRKADLSEAELFDADLTQANLSGAELTDANLTGADLREASLFGTDFREASLGWTILADVDLSTAQGLDDVQHHGPSIIDVSALYRSHGNIPEVFLRGAGVPEDFISYVRSLVGRPFEFYSCFISYSSKDQEFAERLHTDLQDKGVRCWFAPHDVQGGRKLHEQIDQANPHP